jgi:hypothetical protein
MNMVFPIRSGRRRHLTLLIAVIAFLTVIAFTARNYYNSSRVWRVRTFLDSDRSTGVGLRGWIVPETTINVNPCDIVSLGVTSIDDDDIHTIALLSNLGELHVEDARTRRFGPLVRLKRLYSLQIYGVLPEDFGFLAQLPHMTELWIGCRDGDSLGTIPQLASIRDFRLSSAHLEASEWRFLERLEAVTTLSLERTNISDLSPLKGLSHLETLNISGTSVSDLSPIVALPKLASLDIARTSVRDVSPLMRCKNLKDLFVWRITDIERTARAELREALPGLYIHQRRSGENQD